MGSLATPRLLAFRGAAAFTAESLVRHLDRALSVAEEKKRFHPSPRGAGHHDPSLQNPALAFCGATAVTLKL